MRMRRLLAVPAVAISSSPPVATTTMTVVGQAEETGGAKGAKRTRAR